MKKKANYKNKKQFWYTDSKKALKQWGLWVTCVTGYQSWHMLSTGKKIKGHTRSTPIVTPVFVDSKYELVQLADELAKDKAILSAVPKKIELPIPENSAPPKNRRHLYSPENIVSKKEIDKMLSSITDCARRKNSKGIRRAGKSRDRDTTPKAA